MNKVFIILLSLVMIFSLAACSSGDIATLVQSNASASGDTAAAAGSGAQTVAEAQAENSAAHESESDYAWDASMAVPIALNGDSINADAAGVQVNGSTVTITAAGAYALSGTLNDGQIIVETEDEGTVQLILNGVDLHSSTSAPIYISNAKKAVIILADGTTNTLDDALTYGNGSTEEDEPNAALFSKADLSISGSGALVVNGNSNDGIASKDGLIFHSGTITVNAVDDGIRGKDYVVVEDGNITIHAGGDGLKSDNEEDATKGYISIAAGTLNVTAGGDGLTAQTDVMISDGAFTIVTAGGSNSSIDETLSAKGIKGVSSVLIDNGTFDINAADDALHSNGSVTVNNGTFVIASGDDGMHADSTLTINAGSIQIDQSYEGLESAVITINAGEIEINASDDGINVAGGVDGSGMQGPGGGPGGGRGQDIFSYDGSYMLYIYGGTIVVNAYGDGLDSNGGVEMSGGTVLVSGPTNSGNGALDAGMFNISGGVLIAAGSAGMAMAPSTSSSQNSVLINFDNLLQADSLVHVQNSAGEEIFTFVPAKEYQSIVFSLPSLAQGESYDVYVGGSASGSNAGGLIQNGTYTPGELYTSLTLSSVVTSLGGMGGFGGGGGGGHNMRP